MLVSVEHLSKMQNVRTIVDDVSFAIEEKDRIALVGVNGTGKSTLLRVIAGKEKADSGTITYRRELRISMLDQDPVFDASSTVLDAVLAGADDVSAYEARSILNRLGMRDMEAEIGILSGGQKKRVALARALLRPCDLLILDEPTNHLDAQMIEWLERYLQKRTSALLMVTHDRYFMERICTKMMELSQAKLYTYQANYSAYLEAKAERLQLEQSREAKRRSLLRKELEWVRAGVQARSTKSRARLERFEQLSAVRSPQQEGSVELNLRSSRLGRKTIECVSLGKRYGDHVLFEHFSLQFKRNERIGIIGENGCGKTTLLKIMAGECAPDSGEVIRGETVKIGFFHQGHDQMDGAMRVIDYIREVSDQIETAQGTRTAAQMLEQFLFDKNLQYNTIGRLSGGEKRRLYLLRVLMSAPNVLFLDEPTNDLDITTLTILEDYLDGFAGAVVAVSHDRYFLDRIAQRIFAYEGEGRIRQYPGGYSDYARLREEDARAQEKPAPKKAEPPREKREKKAKFTFREQKEFETIDADVERAEAAVRGIEAQMEAAQADYVELQRLTQEREQAQAALDALTERWVYLHDLHERMEAEQRNG